MTNEAETAVQISYRMEVRKDALRQTQDNGVKVTFTVHPQDMPAQLYQDLMGQRYVCVLVPLADDDTPRIPAPASSATQDSPVAPDGPEASPVDVSTREDDKASEQPGKRAWGELSYPQRAGIRCADPLYQEFIALEYCVTFNRMLEADPLDVKNVTAAIIREKCAVSSRADIKPGTEAARIFDYIEAQYVSWLRHEHGRDA